MAAGNRGRSPRRGTRRGQDPFLRRPQRGRRGTRRSRLHRGFSATRASGAVTVLGLSTTRRAALLAIVVCALAFTIAVPLRTYLSQQAEVTEQQQRQAELERQVSLLEQRRDELRDPAQVEVEARNRLGYVMPGETPYIVQLPEDRGTDLRDPDGERLEPRQPWYAQLWNSVTDSD